MKIKIYYRFANMHFKRTLVFESNEVESIEQIDDITLFVITKDGKRHVFAPYEIEYEVSP